VLLDIIYHLDHVFLVDQMSFNVHLLLLILFVVMDISQFSHSVELVQLQTSLLMLHQDTNMLQVLQFNVLLDISELI